MAEDQLRIGLLGPIVVTRAGQPIPIGGTKPTALLAALALEPGRVVSVDHLATALWGTRLPDDVPGTVQVYISRLRRALVPPGSSDSAPLVRWQPPGYVLGVAPHAVDVHEFGRRTARAQAHADAGRLTAAAEDLAAALSVWRGPALEDLRDEPFVAGSVARLEAARANALALHLDVELRRGRHAQVLGELAHLVVEQPLDERFWAALMVAEYRCGRPAAALDVYQRARRVLADELGLDPGRDLRDLEQRVLRRDDDLLAVPGRLAATALRPTTTSWGGAMLPPARLTYPNGTEVPITRHRWIIGRAPDNDLVVGDHQASRRHAMIDCIGGSHRLVDLGSTNGTRLNGTRLVAGVPATLADGDRLLIGDAELVFGRDSAGRS